MTVLSLTVHGKVGDIPSRSVAQCTITVRLVLLQNTALYFSKRIVTAEQLRPTNEQFQDHGNHLQCTFVYDMFHV